MKFMIEKFSFEEWVVAISAILYASVGVSFFLKKEYSWAMVWLAYSLANVGLILVKLK